MRELMAATGETANLAIADGGQVVFISQVETHEPIRAFFRPGTRGPIHASGIGKALLAYQAPQAVARIVAEQGLAAFTSTPSPTPSGWRRSWRRSGRAAGRRTTRSARKACAASRRRSSTSSARRWRGCRCRGRRSDGAERRRRDRGAGPRGGRPDHPGDRRHDALSGNRRRLQALFSMQRIRGKPPMTTEILSTCLAFGLVGSATLIAPKLLRQTLVPTRVRRPSHRSRSR